MISLTKLLTAFRYRYEPEFALHSGLVEPGERMEEIIDTGVIAQEVQQVLPDAVKEGGSIILPSGQVIDRFLHVNKVKQTFWLRYLTNLYLNYF